MPAGALRKDGKTQVADEPAGAPTALPGFHRSQLLPLRQSLAAPLWWSMPTLVTASTGVWDCGLKVLFGRPAAEACCER